MTTGLLHPGAMGASLGLALRHARPAERVLWAGEGRSAATKERATAAGLTDVVSLDALVEQADCIISVCPPSSAVEQAQSVRAFGFSGCYVDANAVSPDTARTIGDLFDDFVDGGIVGPPVRDAGTTRLYLAGHRAADVATRFDGSDLETRLVDGGPGSASAVKMCFAAWTKGTSALLLAIRALAEAEGVTDDLLGEWATSMPDLVARSNRTPATVGPKAWRFEGEMHEIADSFAAANLPDGFHRGAAEVYSRLTSLEGRPSTGDDAATIDEVLRLLGS